MKKGLISNIYPTHKILVVILTIILSFLYDWKFSYLFVLPVSILLAGIDGKFVVFIKKVVIGLIAFVSFIFVFKIILDKSNTNVLLDLGFIKISEGALMAGINQTSVLVTLMATMLLFFETTDIEDFMISLQRMNVSHIVTYIILSTLQLIPDMAKKSKVIMQAQQARGIETEGSLIKRLFAFFPSIGPLIISSITDTEDRSITLEVRAFSSDNKKTTLNNIQRGKYANLIDITSIIVFVLLVVWRFIG